MAPANLQVQRKVLLGQSLGDSNCPADGCPAERAPAMDSLPPEALRSAGGQCPGCPEIANCNPLSLHT